MKILFVITGLGLGGAEQVVVTLANQLMAKGHQVKIAYLRGDVIVRPHQNVELIHLGFDGIKNFIKACKNLKKIIQEFKPDVVHAHLFHACLLARLVRITQPMPRLVCTAHSKAIGGKARAWLYRVTDDLSDINTNVSEEATAYFIEQKVFLKQRSCTVTNGIDTQKFKFEPNQRIELRQKFGLTNETVFMAVGRFNEAKDYPNLIDAFLQLKQQNTIKLYIIGDGKLRSQLEAKIQGHSNITLLGARDDVAQLLCMSDIFVLSSAWEGFGLVVAEAMSCERVVVATDCGGVKEVLDQPEWLVLPQNSKLLSEKMQQAVQLSTQQKQQIGQQNRERIIKHYSIERMLNQWLEIYTKAKK